MTVEGMWTMNDDGSFTLAPEFETRLAEAKLAAAEGWRSALVAYLEPKCPYSSEQLDAELFRRVTDRDCTPMELMNEFVLEALGGDLMPHQGDIDNR